MKNKNQHINSLIFAIGISGIDYFIKTNNGKLNSHFLGDINKLRIYYILLFLISFILCEIVYNKIRKINEGK
ncbi:hypothetical protein [Peptostreptococcus canis]|uniref:Uncharacterized protein n=1 Tax=Peptostreptococcus canis TaxID=1159213 RepID=A0ABR6TK47_9FIRM|nr:hypothetical protein [Peptostreptococcus canis]MBC2575782.1 hypothetical protein [Peptostreptococcus canis]MBP1998103.1 hypothetical protein [Peptostreptococcus canis]